MKRLIPIILLTVIACSCNKTQIDNKTDLESANLKGNVWKINKTVFDMEAQSTCPAADCGEGNQIVYEYNKEGWLIESSSLDVDGNIAETSKYIYNDEGSLAEIDKFSGDKIIGKEISVLEGDKMTGLNVYNENNESVSSYKYAYIGSDMSEIQILNEEGFIINSVANEFVNGILMSQTKKDAQGNVTAITKYTLNENNDAIEYLISLPTQNIEYKLLFEYEYDEVGNWIKQTQFYEGHPVNIVLRNITYFTD